MAFLNTRRSDLRRIASSSRGDYTIDDVFSEAWLVSDDIRRKRGFAVDFSNHDDQETVLSWLYSKLVRFSEKHIRFAVKLDKDWDSEDSELSINRLARLLSAPEHFDPSICMELKQEHADPLELTKHSYSQASAYVILLERFNWELESLSEHLQLVASTVRLKIIASSQHMQRQPSLFDRIQRVEYEFQPTIGRRMIRFAANEGQSKQLAWEFA